MKHKPLITTFTTTLFLAGLSGPAATIDRPVFIGIGDLQGMVGLGDLSDSPFGSIASDVSADGRVIGGTWQ